MGVMPSARPSPAEFEAPAIMPDDRRQGDSEEFPLPYMLGGPRPKLPSAGRSRDAARTSATKAKAGAIPHSGDLSEGVPIASPSDASDLVVAEQGAAKARPGDSSTASAKKKKPVKLDPAMLQKLLQKNANRTTEN
jgi:hypothetical protein